MVIAFQITDNSNNWQQQRNKHMYCSPKFAVPIIIVFLGGLRPFLIEPGHIFNFASLSSLEGLFYFIVLFV